MKKSTASLLIPQVREKVEKRIRKEYPDGIPPVGADALRFTFAALATYGRTINFDLKRADGYKNFCNKLWNAARFVLMNCEGFSGASGRRRAEDRCRALDPDAARATRSPRSKRTSRPTASTWLAQALYEFTWNEFCDWFLELSKPALNGDDAAAADSTRHTLLVRARSAAARAASDHSVHHRGNLARGRAEARHRRRHDLAAARTRVRPRSRPTLRPKPRSNGSKPC